MSESRFSVLLRQFQGVMEVVDSGGEAAKKLFELQRTVFSLEEENAALIEENAALKQTVADYKQFDVDRESYVHHQLPSGAWVVVVKADAVGQADTMQDGMYLCERCFSKRQRSILQPIEKRSSAAYLKCHECGSEVMKDNPHKSALDFC
ncbi:hypothetical protein CVH10_08765 [Halomonas sp. ND22Bw]|uniref:hypothetical protein n=1 Tax=Halomonas sp. ND22Bw TaxID=2054178 RepID=UPI000D0BBCF6|nr:hypothetical protein CVH10_08765 [Halomonas sp. ND22Bw]